MTGINEKEISLPYSKIVTEKIEIEMNVNRPRFYGHLNKGTMPLEVLCEQVPAVHEGIQT